MAVTFIGNVPLNEALAHIDPADPAAARVWAGYLTD